MVRCDPPPVAVCVAIQTLAPLRHFLYPGNVSWTEEGHGFSWHMKLRDKESRPEFWASVPGTNRRIDIRPRDYLTSRQARKMYARPFMIIQFARHVKAKLRRQGYPEVTVHSRTLVSLNGRRPQLLVDPEVDLAAQSWTLGHADWIVPLTEPLPTYYRPSLRHLRIFSDG